jgi:hypothetical protein
MTPDARRPGTSEDAAGDERCVLRVRAARVFDGFAGRARRPFSEVLVRPALHRLGLHRVGRRLLRLRLLGLHENAAQARHIGRRGVVGSLFSQFVRFATIHTSHLFSHDSACIYPIFDFSFAN